MPTPAFLHIPNMKAVGKHAESSPIYFFFTLHPFHFDVSRILEREKSDVTCYPGMPRKTITRAMERGEQMVVVRGLGENGFAFRTAVPPQGWPAGPSAGSSGSTPLMEFQVGTIHSKDGGAPVFPSDPLGSSQSSIRALETSQE